MTNSLKRSGAKIQAKLFSTSTAYYFPEPEAVTGVTSITLPAEPGGKRKRVEDEGEITVKVAKKQRGNSSEERASPAEPEPTKRGGRTRRARRSRLEEELNERAKPSVSAAPIPSEDDCVVVHDDLLLQGDTAKKGNKL